MKHPILACILMVGLTSCDRSPSATGSTKTEFFTPRIVRSESVTDSIWNSASVVHVDISTTTGTNLLNDTVLFSMHHLPAVAAPSDKGVVVSIQGLNDILSVVWSGSATLPPSGRDTSLQITVDLVSTSANTRGPSGEKGTINPPAIDSISVDPWNTNTYDEPVRVFLSCVTPGSIIHYTLDGSPPMAYTQTYGDTGILIDSTQTLKAIATSPGWTNSAILTRSFVLQARPATLSITGSTEWAPDTYDSPVNVSLQSPTPFAEIRCTFDGSIPTQTSPLCHANLTIDTSTTLTARVFSGKCLPSLAIIRKSFVLQAQPVVLLASKDSGWPPFTINLYSPTEEAEIHYTLAGNVPSADSTTFSNPLVFYADTDTMTVSAIAVTRRFPKIATSKPVTATYRTIVPWNGAVKYGTLFDIRDNQSYRTIQIGTQRWMAENLNFVSENITSWCQDCHKFGRMYTWASAMGLDQNIYLLASWGVRDINHQGACPGGWHVPSKSEWQKLTDTLLEPSTAAFLLKANSQAWSVWGQGPGRDSLGMRILPSFFDSAGFWSSTEAAPDSAWEPSIVNTSYQVGYQTAGKLNNLYVRCIED